MRWSERQRAMLREMAVHLWEREAPTADVPLAGPGDANDANDVGDANEVFAASPPAARGPAPADRAAQAAPMATRRLPDTAASAVAWQAADWLVVGEPFEAADGTSAQAQLLDNMLRAIGAARDGATRAGRAVFVPLADRPTAGAGALGDESQRRAVVRAAIDAVQPKCIVALGRSAAQALFASDEPLGALRGRRHASAGVAMVVTCSLAFLLRHPDEKARVWADLCLAVRAVDEPLA